MLNLEQAKLILQNRNNIRQCVIIIDNIELGLRSQPVVSIAPLLYKRTNKMNKEITNE